MAHEEKTGARGLVSVIERVLLPFEKRLPSSSIRTLVVTRDLVLHPEEELRYILGNPEDLDRKHAYRAILEEEKSRVRKQLGDRHRHYLENYPHIFTQPRLELVLDHHMRSGWSLESIFEEVMLLYNQIRILKKIFIKTTASRSRSTMTQSMRSSRKPWARRRRVPVFAPGFPGTMITGSNWFPSGAAS